MVTGEQFIPLTQHLELMREADALFQTERDRRYAEVNIEKEKALKIKETADLTALQLAREIQTYKDEKANLLREQINSERGIYATKEDVASLRDYFDAAHKPIAEYVATQQGRLTGTTSSIGEQRTTTNQRLVILGVVISVIVLLANILPLVFH